MSVTIEKLTKTEEVQNLIARGQEQGFLSFDEVAQSVAGVDVDEATAEDAQTWYADGDEDTYGDSENTQRSCTQPDGYVTDNTDCNDERAD